MQGVQSSYKTDRGVKGLLTYQLDCHVVEHKHVLDELCTYVGGATGNIRARFEQMAKQEDEVKHAVCC